MLVLFLLLALWMIVRRDGDHLEGPRNARGELNGFLREFGNKIIHKI